MPQGSKTFWQRNFPVVQERPGWDRESEKRRDNGDLADNCRLSYGDEIFWMMNKNTDGDRYHAEAVANQQILSFHWRRRSRVSVVHRPSGILHRRLMRIKDLFHLGEQSSVIYNPRCMQGLLQQLRMATTHE